MHLRLHGGKFVLSLIHIVCDPTPGLACIWQDKKNRFYVVSALADAKVDLKGI